MVKLLNLHKMGKCGKEIGEKSGKLSPKSVVGIGTASATVLSIIFIIQ